MSIPDYESIMHPLLKHCADGGEHRFRDIVEAMASVFDLSTEDRKVLLPSGKYPLFRNRVGWARTYLVQAGLLSSPKREYVVITDRGLKALKKSKKIDRGFLSQYKEFQDFQQRGSGAKRGKKPKENQESATPKTPDEIIESIFTDLRSELCKELLSSIKNCSDGFFEDLVVDLLLAMGYGGSRKEAGQRLGKTGDHGIDGVIKEDRLGLDAIYIQAKRWDEGHKIGEREIRDFIGALHMQGATKGCFITTSDFTPSARAAAERASFSIVLINGETVASHMVDYDIGVTRQNVYEIKRIDSDYFQED